MDDILRETADILKSGEAVALASLVESSGSIPMSDRAKMLVRGDCSALGTIGGGCLEAEIVSTCLEVLDDGASRTTSYTMTEKQAGESGLNCGGTVRIYSERLAGEVDAQLFTTLVEARQMRKVCVMATVLSDPQRRRAVYQSDGGRLGCLRDEALEASVEEQAREVVNGETAAIIRLDDGCGSEIEVFLEPFVPPPKIYIFGGGHVGGEIARLANAVGFRVTLIDDRPSFANPEHYPYVDECLVEEMDRSFSALDIDDQSFVIAATRGHQHDEVVVEQAIRTRARYIGMLGSERKKQVLWKRIIERGGDGERLEGVFAPIGFNIGADNPQEIAVSVVAELIKVRRGIRKEWKTKRVGTAA